MAFGKLVYRGSHSCCSLFDRICLKLSGAFTVAARWSFEVGYQRRLGLQLLQARYQWLCQIFKICEWSVSSFLFPRSFSQHVPMDFRYLVGLEYEYFTVGRMGSYQTSNVIELDTFFQMVSHPRFLVSSFVQIDEVGSLRNCRPL